MRPALTASMMQGKRKLTRQLTNSLCAVCATGLDFGEVSAGQTLGALEGQVQKRVHTQVNAEA